MFVGARHGGWPSLPRTFAQLKQLLRRMLDAHTDRPSIVFTRQCESRIPYASPVYTRSMNMLSPAVAASRRRRQSLVFWRGRRC